LKIPSPGVISIGITYVLMGDKTKKENSEQKQLQDKGRRDKTEKTDLK
jgi:hypothetical protein